MYRILLRFKRFIKRTLKVKAETRQDISTRTSSKIYKYLMLIVTAILVAFIYPAENLFRPLDFPQKGEVARKDIIAPFKIVITKSDQELQQDRKSASETIPTIIDYNSNLVDSVLSNFDRFINEVDKSIKIYQERKKQNNNTDLNNLHDSLINKLINKFPFYSENIYERLLEIQNIEQDGKIVKEVLTNDIYFSGVLSNLNTLPEMPNQSVIVRIGKREVFYIRDKLVDLSQAYMNFWSILNKRSEKTRINVEDCYELGRHFIVSNLRVNAEEIAARRIAAEEEVPVFKEIVAVGDVIARAGDKINERQAEILAEIYQQKQSESADNATAWLIFPVLARFALILASFFILYLYLYYFHYQIYASNPKLLALFFIYAIELVFVYIIGIKLDSSVYLYPIAIFSILVTVLFDSEVATVNVFVFALILGILHRFNFPLVLIAIIVGITASYSIQHVKQRSEFFRPIIYLALVYIALIAILESFQITPSEDFMNLIGFG
ncbi:MAG: hypothetical protein ABIJ45_07705, partial [Candidatus Zixiibacteriota bacterium]